MWQKLRQMPKAGDRVRCIRFGDDCDREGSVTFVHQGRIWVDFTFKEEVYQAPSLEIYVPRS